MEYFSSSSVEDELAHPPVFILGAPRSGSTLLMQVLCEAFDVAYLSNQHGVWYGAPHLVPFPQRPLLSKEKGYESVHGDTKGPKGPSECPQWWYRFFPRHQGYISTVDTEVTKMKWFRRSLLSMTCHYDRPVLFKNLLASLRLEPITKWIPESRFIVLERDLLDNAHSILETRMKVFGSYETWWSMEPQGAKDFSHPEEQVVAQIQNTYETIERDLARLNVAEKDILNLRYEDLCSDPESLLEKVSEFLSISDEVKRYEFQPPHFKKRNEIRIDHKLYERLRSYVAGI